MKTKVAKTEVKAGPDKAQPKTQLRIDSKNNVYAGEVKICRIDLKHKTLLFLDKDRRRASKRGSNQVPVPIAELAKLANAS